MGVIIRLKLQSNIVYKVDDLGNIKSENNIMTILERNEHITKIKENVIMRFTNLLYDGQKIKRVQYDMLVDELLLELEPLEVEE